MILSLAEAASDRGTGPPRSRWRAGAVLGSLAVLAILLLASGVDLLSGFGRLLLVVLGLALLFWFGGALLRRLLWRVGRRLAFTYLLVGVLPLLLVTAQALVGLYLLSGFVLGQVFRSQLQLLSAEVVAVASARDPEAAAGVFDHVEIAAYRDGRRHLAIADSPAPEAWPQWLADETLPALENLGRSHLPFLVELGDGTIAVAAALGNRDRGALAYSRRAVTELVAERAGVWADLVPRPARSADGRSTIAIGNTEWLLRPLRRAQIPEPVASYFGAGASFYVIGYEAAGPLFDLATAQAIDDNLAATLFAPPTTVIRHLFSGSVEVDTQAWIAFLVPAFLLFDLYVVTTLMAGLLVYGLSRAVNRLSQATAAVQSGDFSTRIPVRRRDQIGALQESFNQMTANLESLVEEAAQKELLEKELQIATEVQKSLLPGAVPLDESLEVATFFEPSAAIGGDYFDLVRFDRERRRIAVVIADVSGHGIPAGLRMAMLKAAFEILVREQKDTAEILDALDRLVRVRRDQGGFVTATLTLIELESGAVEITNAGHPPTYLLRDGTVEEIVLPGNPLGALGPSYGQRRLELKPGDVLVWLSDGLIEATNGDDEAFGYERVVTALAGDASSAEAVRDRLIEAVRDHSGSTVAEDDQTMVALRYLGGGG